MAFSFLIIGLGVDWESNTPGIFMQYIDFHFSNFLPLDVQTSSYKRNILNKVCKSLNKCLSLPSSTRTEPVSCCITVIHVPLCARRILYI